MRCPCLGKWQRTGGKEADPEARLFMDLLEDHRELSSAGAFAPEEIGGEAESKECDGDGQVNKLFRIEERNDDGVADDGGGREDEEERSPGIARDAIGN